MEYITLNGVNKLKMPIVGLGTWRATAVEVENAVHYALESGYRHFDTAFVYYNETAIGNTLKKWLEPGKITREDLFITTKLPVFANRPQDVERFINMSLERLQLTYVDLYLLHGPFALYLDEETKLPAINEDGSYKIDFDTNHIEIWKAMEKLVKTGKTKAIGLSNFNANQVRAIHEKVDIKPTVLQVELHAYLQQKDLRDTCKQLKVAVTAYSPLGSPGADKHFLEKYNYSLPTYPDILHEPLIAELSEKYQKIPGQILLKHLIQKGIIIIPKSSNPERIKQNIDIFNFTISPEDVEKLDALDKGERGRIFTFLFWKGIEKHPHYPFQHPTQ